MGDGGVVENGAFDGKVFISAEDMMKTPDTLLELAIQKYKKQAEDAARDIVEILRRNAR